MNSILPLIGLALLDSLSVGAIVVPIGLLLTWGSMRKGAYATYLATVATVYFALGLMLLGGTQLFFGFFAELNQQKWFSVAKIGAGSLLAAYGILSPTPKKKTAEDDARVSRKRGFGPLAMVGLGLAVSFAEAATMVPYLAAISIVQAMQLPGAGQAGVLAGYCVVMIIPAIVVGVLAGAYGEKLFPRLQRIAHGLEYETKVTLLWVAAIVGIYLIVQGWGELGHDF